MWYYGIFARGGYLVFSQVSKTENNPELVEYFMVDLEFDPDQEEIFKILYSDILGPYPIIVNVNFTNDESNTIIDYIDGDYNEDRQD
jgi:hypothetical protein